MQHAESEPEAGASAPSQNDQSSNNTSSGGGQAFSASGGKSTVTNAEDTGNSFEASLAQDIAREEGISFEEALERVKNGDY